MLSERKAAILQAVVEGYIATSEPVGSAQVVRQASLDVSSATVRSELAALEEAGYLVQPHTSAGRVPSDKGYRYFVDTLMEPYTLEQTQQRRVASFFDAAKGELERLLRDTSAFLAQLTDYAAVIVPPTPELSPVRALHTVRLAPDLAMVVIVHANTAIDKIVVPVDPDVDEATLERASHQLAAAHSTGSRPEATADPLVDALVDHLDAAITRTRGDQTAFVGGASTIAGVFDAAEKVREVLDVLEKQYLVVSLITDVIDRGLNVAIGSETGVEPLADCALVVAPIEIAGRPAGSIGVLGPSRMHYPQAVATVALFGQQLGRRLEEGSAS